MAPTGNVRVKDFKIQKSDYNYSYWIIPLHKNVKNWNDPWCLQPQFSKLLLGQNLKARSVLKSSEQADFKTDLTF